jgi:hypothetical protein
VPKLPATAQAGIVPAPRPHCRPGLRPQRGNSPTWSALHPGPVLVPIVGAGLRGRLFLGHPTGRAFPTVRSCTARRHRHPWRIIMSCGKRYPRWFDRPGRLNGSAALIKAGAADYPFPDRGRAAWDKTTSSPLPQACILHHRRARRRDAQGEVCQGAATAGQRRCTAPPQS